MKRFAVWCWMSLATVLPGFGHPHAWADVRIGIEVHSGTVGDLWVELTFDDIYSAVLLADIAPGARVLDAKAVDALQAQVLPDLAAVGYFGHLTLGPKTLPLPDPVSFFATVDQKGRLTYRFTFRLSVQLPATVPLAVSFYDPSYYIDMQYAVRNPVSFRSVGKGKASYELKAFPTMSYYGGQATPSFAVLTWQP